MNIFFKNDTKLFNDKNYDSNFNNHKKYHYIRVTKPSVLLANFYQIATEITVLVFSNEGLIKYIKRFVKIVTKLTRFHQKF